MKTATVLLLTVQLVSAAVLLGACAPQRSELFGKLIPLLEKDREAVHSLYNGGGVQDDPDAGNEIGRLVADGFVLEVGDFPDQTYVECGTARVPINDPFIMTREGGLGFRGYGYRVYLTVNEACELVRAEGAKLGFAQF